MASWSEFAAAAPELAERVQERFDAHKHKTMATLRSDGSPRISGTETQFPDGELWIGSMWKAVKALDLQRDPRFAIHSGDDRRTGRRGEGRRRGRGDHRPERVGAQTTPRAGGAVAPLPARRARGLDRRPQRGAQQLVIEVWTPERGVRVITRS